jgi:hypothetical protein
VGAMNRENFDTMVKIFEALIGRIEKLEARNAEIVKQLNVLIRAHNEGY